jgi:hypothetical protein
MATLKFEVKGQVGSITLRGFLTAVESALRMLSDYDAAISGKPKGTLDWIITDVSTGSLRIVTQSCSRIEDRNFGPEVADRFIKGWSEIERHCATPAYLSEQGMKQARQLTRLIGREGMTGFAAASQTVAVEITPQASANIEQLLKVRQCSIGCVEGKLETISIHGESRFIIYHPRTGKAVTCRVPPDRLRTMISTEMLGRRIIASGKVCSNMKGEPLRVDAEDIKILRRNEELPPTSALSGLDPNFTGNLSTEEYIRSLRSG